MKLPSTRLLVVVIVALVLVIIGIVAFGVTSSNKNTGPIPTPVVEEPSLNISVQDVEAKDDLTDATYSRTRGMFYVSSVDESLLYVINPDTGRSIRQSRPPIPVGYFSRPMSRYFILLTVRSCASYRPPPSIPRLR